MKKFILGLSLFLASCSKPASNVQAPPTPSSETQASIESRESKFVLPPVAKKQAKYFPEGTPTRAIQDLDDMLDSYITDPKTPEDRRYNADLKKYVIHGTFDMRELSRFALGKHWEERTAAERDYFVDLMLRLLEKKAIFSKEQGQKKTGKKKALYKVAYAGDGFLNAEKMQSLVRTTLNIPSENLKIGLNYKLKKAGEEWKIYDVIVDGASLVDNYRYQFDRIIAKDGYPSLVQRMEAKLKEIQGVEG